MVAAGLGLATAVSFSLAIPALAAIAAGLSTSVAQPGVRVHSDNNGHLTAYSDLVTCGPEPVYIVSTTDFEKEIARYGDRQRDAQINGR